MGSEKIGVPMSQQQDMFEKRFEETLKREAPLATRMRLSLRRILSMR